MRVFRHGQNNDGTSQANKVTIWSSPSRLNDGTAITNQQAGPRDGCVLRPTLITVNWASAASIQHLVQLDPAGSANLVTLLDETTSSVTSWVYSPASDYDLLLLPDDKLVITLAATTIISRLTVWCEVLEGMR